MVEAVAHDLEGARGCLDRDLPLLANLALNAWTICSPIGRSSLAFGRSTAASRWRSPPSPPERAGVVHRLNDEGVPVLAIPLLSFDEGYYFTPDNFLRAAERYQE
jgi:hypothetical protein